MMTTPTDPDRSDLSEPIDPAATVRVSRKELKGIQDALAKQAGEASPSVASPAESVDRLVSPPIVIGDPIVVDLSSGQRGAAGEDLAQQPSQEDDPAEGLVLSVLLLSAVILTLLQFPLARVFGWQFSDTPTWGWLVNLGLVGSFVLSAVRVAASSRLDGGVPVLQAGILGSLAVASLARLSVESPLLGPILPMLPAVAVLVLLYSQGRITGVELPASADNDEIDDLYGLGQQLLLWAMAVAIGVFVLRTIHFAAVYDASVLVHRVAVPAALAILATSIWLAIRSDLATHRQPTEGRWLFATIGCATVILGLGTMFGFGNAPTISGQLGGIPALGAQNGVLTFGYSFPALLLGVGCLVVAYRMTERNDNALVVPLQSRTDELRGLLSEISTAAPEAQWQTSYSSSSPGISPPPPEPAPARELSWSAQPPARSGVFPPRRAALFNRFVAQLLDGAFNTLVVYGAVFFVLPYLLTLSLENEAAADAFRIADGYPILAFVVMLALLPFLVQSVLPGAPTFGRIICGVRLERYRTGGKRIGLWRTLWRSTVYGLGGMILLGFLSPLFNDEGRGWHDLAADTVAVKARHLHDR